MHTERLTTLAAVKDWLNIDGDGSDTTLTRLIDAASQFVLLYLNRDSFRRATYTQNFKGYGSPAVLLKNWPILAVTSVGVNGSLVPASTFNNGMPSQGYYVSDPGPGPQTLNLMGRDFPRGLVSQVIYEAGFETTSPFTVGTDNLTFTPSSQVWNSDLGVSINGSEATKVDADPAAGEYAVDEWGTYTFSADDDGLTAIVAYSYTPAAVAQGTVEIIGEWFKRKDRIGVLSKTLGGQETVTFSQQDMNSSVRSMLQPFRNVVPV
jgi:hypothetical protein